MVVEGASGIEGLEHSPGRVTRDKLYGLLGFTCTVVSVQRGENERRAENRQTSTLNAQMKRMGIYSCSSRTVCPLGEAPYVRLVAKAQHSIRAHKGAPPSSFHSDNIRINRRSRGCSQKFELNQVKIIT